MVGERDREEIAVQTKSGSSVFVMLNECLCDAYVCACKPSIESVPPPAIFHHKWFLGFGLSNCFLFVLLNSQNIFEMLMPVRVSPKNVSVCAVKVYKSIWDVLPSTTKSMFRWSFSFFVMLLYLFGLVWLWGLVSHGSVYKQMNENHVN